MRKTKPERNIKFRNVQQNILSPNSESYYATHYIGSTIRSVGYNEGRVSRDIQPAGFSSKDSIGLESMFPRIASDFFKVQIPKEPPPLPIQVHQIDRREYNMAHDTVRPSQTSGLQIAKEPEYVQEVDEGPAQIVPDDVEYVEEVAPQTRPDVPEFIEPVAEKPLSRKERKALFAEQQSEAEQQRVKADEKRFTEERAKKDEINRKAREKRAQKKAEAEAEAEAEQAAALQKKPIQKIIKIKKGKA
jgi:hypothetical protein